VQRLVRRCAKRCAGYAFCTTVSILWQTLGFILMAVVQALCRLLNFDVEGKKRQKGVHNGLHAPRASSHACIDV
jgi:hypothetical protein